MEERNESRAVKRKISAGAVLGIVFSCLVIVFAVAYFFLYRVTLKDKVFTYELGREISSDPSDYLDGVPFFVGLSYVDISGVDDKETGMYSVEIRHFPFSYSAVINIEDTIAPVMIAKPGLVFAANEDYFVEECLALVSDADEKTTVRFSGESSGSGAAISDSGRRIRLSKTGEKSVGLIATDSSGNVSEIFVDVTVDERPEIDPLYNYYTAVGTPVDLSCFAFDAEDGEISNSVTVDVEDSYYDNIGAHEVKYSVTDSAGLSGEASSTVYVYEPQVIQDMFNRGILDDLYGNVFGLLNPYDSGYTVEHDIDSALARMVYCAVRIDYSNAYVRSNGSGYVLKIDGDEIIIGTNCHVVGDEKKVQVSFYDGTTYTGTVVNRQKSPDIAFVKLTRNSGTLPLLKTVHVNLNYFNTLTNKPGFPVAMYCTDGKGGEWLSRNGYILRKQGKLAQYFPDYNYYVTEVTVDLVPGVSGSAIVDSHGNFICMATFYWLNNGNKEDYGVFLPDILDFYQQTFGERLEYY